MHIRVCILLFFAQTDMQDRGFEDAGTGDPNFWGWYLALCPNPAFSKSTAIPI